MHLHRLSISCALSLLVIGTGCSDLLTPEKVREHLDNPTAAASASTLPRSTRDYFAAQRVSGAQSFAFLAKGLAGGSEDDAAISGALATADNALSKAGIGDVVCAGGFIADAATFDGCEVGNDCDAELVLDSCIMRAGGDDHATGKIVFRLKNESSDTLGEAFHRSELRLTFEDFEVTDGDEVDYFDGLLAIETTAHLDGDDAEGNVEVIISADLIEQRRRIERGWFDDGMIESHRATAGIRFTATADEETASFDVELLAFIDENDDTRDESLVLVFGADAREVSPDQTIAEATLSVRGSNGDFTCTWGGASETADDDVITVQSEGSCVDENGETFEFSGTASGR